MADTTSGSSGDGNSPPGGSTGTGAVPRVANEISEQETNTPRPVPKKTPAPATSDSEKDADVS